MPRHGPRKSRNWGYGKKIIYAGKNALRTIYRRGHFGTVAAHTARWRKFCDWLKSSQQINDARLVTIETLILYAQYVAAQGYTPTYSQNLLSSVNVTLECLRGDSEVCISPLKALGPDFRRSNIRTVIPNMSHDTVDDVCTILCDEGHRLAAAVIGLCRAFGLRCREAAMLDARSALVIAERGQPINITEGTKNGRGRYVDRFLSVSPQGRQALQGAAEVQETRRNLIPEDMTCAGFLSSVRNAATSHLKAVDIKSVRHLRAAYACERYQEITKHEAPLMTGHIHDRDDDRKAREIISQELGHSRIDDIGAYVGGRRLKKQKKEEKV